MVAAAGTAWLAVDALRAREALEAVASRVGGLSDQVVAGDGGAAAASLAELQRDAGIAFDATHGPHWWLAQRLPVVGEDVAAVRVVSGVVQDLAQDALPALLSASSLVDPATIAPTGGRVDLAPLQAAAPQVVRADEVVQDSVARLAGLRSESLVASVRKGVEDLRGGLDSVAVTTATASRAVRLLPPMLGADSPRQYLLLVQNNAEARSTGGIAGSVVLLRAQDGVVEFVEQRAGNLIESMDAPIAEVTGVERSLFGDYLARTMLDVTFTPDFPRTGELARALWTHSGGPDVDGVLSVDPVALGGLLEGLGPVRLSDGTELTSANTAELLLNLVYRQLEDPLAQDAFFGQVAEAVFGAVVAGQGDAEAMLAQLAQASREGRFLVWSAHPAEQALLEGTVLSGELSGVRDGAPVVGLFFNDGSRGKMSYYLDRQVQLVAGRCSADGVQQLRLVVTLTNTGPAGGRGLPDYVNGGGQVVPRGDIRTNVLLYAPEGGYISRVVGSDGVEGGAPEVHDGLPVLGRTVQLHPGESHVLEYDVFSGQGQSKPALLRSTPQVRSTPTSTWTSHCSS